MSGVSLTCILLFAFFGCILSNPLAPLNSACGQAQPCMGGAVCMSNVCKCPQPQMPSGGGCIFAEPRPVPAPIFAPAPAPIFAPAPAPIFAPAPAPVLPLPGPAPMAAPFQFGHPGQAPFSFGVAEQAPWGAPFAGQGAWAGPVAAHAPLPAGHGAWGAPFGGPAPAPFAFHGAGPLPVPAPLAPAGPAYAWPGSSCSGGRLCLGNSFCQQGSCGCPTNYVQTAYTCVEAALVPAPAPAPVPYFPRPVPAPAPAPAFYIQQAAPLPAPVFAPAQYAPAPVFAPQPAPIFAAPRAAIVPHTAAVFAAHAAPVVAAAPAPVFAVPAPRPAMVETTYTFSQPAVAPGPCNPVAGPCGAGPQPGPGFGFAHGGAFPGPQGGFAHLLANPLAAPFPFPFAPFTSKLKAKN